jgi:hypothetical protein
MPTFVISRQSSVVGLVTKLDSLTIEKLATTTTAANAP